MNGQTKAMAAPKENHVSTIVGLGVLTAIVIILQALALNIRFGVFSITLVLVPIIVGAALYSYKAGAWLGLVFGTVVLLTGDAAPFLAVNAPGTVFTVLAKGILAGLVAGLVYTAAAKKNALLAAILAGIVAPVTNTGIFLIGCRLFFYGTIQEWAANAGFENAAAYMIVGLVGVNFLVELIINLVLAAAIVQIVRIIKKNTAK